MATNSRVNYKASDSVPSNTLKRHPKMELNKTDLLKLLSYLEGELQARDVVIAALKADKAKQFLYQAKYGRFGLGDPFHALQRDSDMVKDNSFDEAAVKKMYDNQLFQLEHLIDTQRTAHLRMTEQLASIEKRYHKVCSELEDEKRKHAQDTAQGDDVTMLLEKERERLRNEVDFEKSQNKKVDKEVKKLTTQLEEERATSTKHKQVAILLIKERQRVSDLLAEERQKVQTLAVALNQVKNRTREMAEELSAETRRKAMQMEATMEKRYMEFDIEREQLKARLGREERKTAELLRELERVKAAGGGSGNSGGGQGNSGGGQGNIGVPGTGQEVKTPVVNRIKPDVPIRTTPMTSRRTSGAPNVGVVSGVTNDGARTSSGHVSVSKLSVQPSATTNTVKKSGAGQPQPGALASPIPGVTSPTAAAGRGAPPPLPPTKPIYNPVKKEVVGRTPVTKPTPPAKTKVVIESSTKKATQLPGGAPTLDSTDLDFIGPEMADLQQLLVSMATGESGSKDVNSQLAAATLICHLSSIGSLEHLQRIITTHPNIPINQPINGQTAVHCASKTGHTHCLQLLLQYGAEADTVSHEGFTALQYAAQAGHAECVQVLLHHGCDVQNTDMSGRTALYLAGQAGHSEVCKVLLQHGSRLDIKTQAGWTPVHATVQAGHIQCTQLLLTYTPAHLHTSLAAASAVAKMADKDGWTIAHLAAIRDSEDCLRLVLDLCDPDLQLEDKWGRNVQQVASLRCRQLIESRENKSEKNCAVVIDVEPQVALSCKNAESSYNVGRLVVSDTTTWAELEESLDHMITSHLEDIGRGLEMMDSTKADGQGYSLGLSLDSVKHYSIGSVCWKPKQSLHTWSPGTPSSHSPFEILANNDQRQIHVTLFGWDDQCQDSLAYETLISSNTLQGYIRVIEQFKSVILYGHSGTCKTYLSQVLASCVQVREKACGNSALVHVVPLTPDMTHQQLATILRDKGCLVKAGDPPPVNLTPVVVLGNLNSVNLANVFGNILTCLEHRGSGCTITIPTDEGEVSVYLQAQCYIIGTMNRTRSSGLDLSVQRSFRWLHCQLDSEPVKGLLSRHLYRRYLHKHAGVEASGLLVSAIRWVTSVQYRLNEGLDKLGLPELVFGPGHFLCCPVEVNMSKAVLRWLVQLWNHMIAPKVIEAVSKNSDSNGQQKVASTVLYVLLQRAVVPGCPLTGQEKERYLSSFQGSGENDKRRSESPELSSATKEPMAPRSSSFSGVVNPSTPRRPDPSPSYLAKSQPNLTAPLTVRTTELGTPLFTPLSPKSPTLRSVQSPSLSHRLRTEFFKDLSPPSGDA